MGSIIRRFAFTAIPLAIAAVAVAASLAAEVAPDPGSGLHLAFSDGQVVVSSVDAGSLAQRSGIESGRIVVRLDGPDVVLQSDEAKRELVASNRAWQSVDTVKPEDLGAYKTMTIETKAWESDAAQCVARSNCELFSVFTPTVSPASEYGAFLPGFQRLDLTPFVVGLAILLLGWWWVGSGRAGSNLRPFWLSLPLATAVPVLTLPLDRYYTLPAMVAGSTLVALAMIPLAIDFTARIEGRRLRWFVGAIAMLLAAAAVQVGLQLSSGYRYEMPAATWFLTRVLVFGPILLLPLAAVYLWRTERGWRRWLIAGAGLVLALGSMWLTASESAPFGSSVTSFHGPDFVSPGMYVFRDFLGRGYAAAPLAMMPLVVVNLRRLTMTRGRWFSFFVVIGLAVGLTMAVIDGYGGIRLWRAVLAGAIVFVPGLVLARPFGRADGSVPTGSPARSLIASVDVLMASVTPGIACVGLIPEYSMSVWPILTWLVLLLLATRLTVRPLTKLLSNATQERDLIVAATEAERARIAADIHDDALQDLTMLVRRLDAAGDTANAQAAREIAERLRAICGDLRLPVLDDLGVGPALEWLCGRLGGAEKIELDRADTEVRLPADVELAIFRVAQEALSNAVRHGAPPILVKYRARDGRAELEVRDAGNGIPEGAAAAAGQTGHLGLMNMSQRAEAIGAALEVESRPASGTRVALVWEQSVAAPNSGAGAPAVTPAPA